MKFRVLFIAAAFLALTTLGFGQAYINFNYYYCPDEAAMTDNCFDGTPIPNGAGGQFEIYEVGTPPTFLGYNGHFNGDGDPVYCGPGYFAGEPPVTWYVGRSVFCEFWGPTKTHDEMHGDWHVFYRDSCRWSTAQHPWTTVQFDNAVETDHTWWTCVCFHKVDSIYVEPAQFDFGDLGFTHAPPAISLECPNNGPAGVPYPNPFVGIGDCHLGQGITAEVGPLVENLDLFDDGVFFVPGTGPSAPMWDACIPQSVIVTLVGGGQMFLSAWKDGNMDGDFADVLCLVSSVPAPEWIIQDVPVQCPGEYTFWFKDPGCPVDPNMSYDGVYRFILCDHPVGSFGWQEASCTVGEVEDYYRLVGEPGHQVPVELTAAPIVKSGDRQLTLSFNVADETDVTTYEIWRDGTKITELTKANGSYSYVDQNLVNDRLYNYTIVAVALDERKELSFDGKTVWSGTPSYLSATVTEYALHQNYPNPFNPTTEIVYDVVETGSVTLKVFNVMGQEVSTLVNGTVEAGRHTATFNAAGLTSGLYFYTITIGDNFTATKKMLLVQ